ncbi:Lysosomal protective protein [Aphelenchoides bicaudatus]|nr:Lysosomal protective protein [Aphelenchoides bicaudatus]
MSDRSVKFAHAQIKVQLFRLVESQRNPSTDPLVLWLNGGPGCSSLVGMFTELGPFYNNPDGKTLFENVYAWNKVANIIFLESPRNTTNDNAEAIVEFLKRYPEYNNREFFVTGESYGGVYIPRLVDKLLDIIINDPTKLPIKFSGAAIGNGILNENYQTNSFVNLAFYRGMSDYDITKYLLNNCCDDNKSGKFEYCNFSRWVEFAPNQTVIPVKNGDSKTEHCGDYVKNIVVDMLYNTKGYQKYSHEQSCYAETSKYNDSSAQPTFLQVSAQQERIYNISETPIITDGVRRFIDLANQRNMLSSDQFGGFPCYNNEIVEKYLNLPEVLKALHIDIKNVNNGAWSECFDDLDTLYIRQTRDTMPLFTNISDKLSKTKTKFRFLIYNGDADGVCNFLGDEWFTEDLKKPLSLSVTTTRQQWYYQKDAAFTPAPVGFYKTFTSDNLLIDLVTVSGAGHYVPTYRPQPALQMFSNFLAGERNYSASQNVSVRPHQIKQEFKPQVPDTISRSAADQIFYLPGLTFNVQFQQHSGYLKGKDGHYLHYWLMRSQNNPTDPLVLWLNGGPGCSSLGGALTELGPFRPNPDGVTLSENIYSWNQAAHLLFLEAPRGVGFSYQNMTIDKNMTYSDELTIEENILALKDFFSIYTEFQDKEFYITGESYGGVYVPTLTRQVIREIQSGNLPAKLVGMAVGNGELSAIEQIRSAGPLMYHRGILDKNQWDAMLSCCGGDYNNLAFCDVTQFVYLDPAGNAQPVKDDTCGLIFGDIVQKFWNYSLVVVAIHVQMEWSLTNCYQQKQIIFGSRQVNRHKETIREMILNDPRYQALGQSSVNTLQNVFSTDNQGGFPCFASSAAAQWLNTPDVRKALHVPDYVQNWSDCNDTINANYIQQYNDTKDVFDDIINSGYPMRLLIYNGDVDNACNFVGDQWFIEKTVARNNLTVAKKHLNWNMRGVIAGYVKQFKKDDVTIDLVTVKGAGHLVPTDRPEAAYQMIRNFIGRQGYNRTYSAPPKSDLLAQYSAQENFAKATGPVVSPVDLVANAHPQLHAAQKYLAATGSKKRETSENKEATKPEDDNNPPFVITGNQAYDKISDLPGLDFTVDQYSGYLNISDTTHMRYWFVKSQNDPTKDPLILWLNGGPGCSSLGGLFKENGPFKPVKVNGEIKLQENLFSWNRFANVLYLESPRGVGFSFADSNQDQVYNDTQTALDNVAALRSFLDLFGDFKKRPFFVTGESYGGVYVPTLVDKILELKDGGDLVDLNLKGFAVGNGILSAYAQINSAVHLLYYRGVYDLQTYQSLLSCCTYEPFRDGSEQKPCDFARFVTIDKQGNAQPKYTNNDTWNKCSDNVVQYGFTLVWTTLNSVYNTYQDCYDSPSDSTANQENEEEHVRQKRAANGVTAFPTIPPLRNKYNFIDQAKLSNRQSTDAFGGFPCSDATTEYLRNATVRQKLHIPDQVPAWSDCNQQMNDNYVQEHNDTLDVFSNILKTSQRLIGKGGLTNFKVLIYNGDADMACEFLGDEWFIYSLANTEGLIPRDERSPWYYAEPFNDTNQYMERLAGFSKHFLTGKLSLDLLTVKGAGHFVPLDRPGPALQMIKNFVENDPTENNLIDYSKPLEAEYLIPKVPVSYPKTTLPSRKELDKVDALPGATFDPGFNQYSGYLTGKVEGNYLHYWLVEHQDPNKVQTAPLVLWLTGGPSCSSLGAAFGENGPYFVNPGKLLDHLFALMFVFDCLSLEIKLSKTTSKQTSRTLTENVYSWNKAANILYLESPRAIGYSYQDKTKNKDNDFDDNKSADDVTWALADFLTAYPEYYNRDFYITGESYGGVYVPTTAARIIDELENTTGTAIFNGLGMNLKGFFIGNGYVSNKQDVNTMLDFYYFHGLMGRDTFDAVHECCAQQNSDVCDLSNPPKNKDCDTTIDEAFSVHIDVYNIYQQCYENTVDPFGSTSNNDYHDRFQSNIAKMRHSLKQAILHKVKGNAKLSSIFTQQGKMNYASTDANGGFYCYMTNQIEKYLNQKHVRDVLHVPTFVQDYVFCRSDHDNTFHYKGLYSDVTEVFKKIINSNYVTQNFTADNPFQITLHNGDNDLVCDHMEAEYFTENLKQYLNGETVDQRQPWRAYLPGGGLNGGNATVAGWHKRFKFNNGNVRYDLVTVKGSGHFVPLDRPLPAIQLFNNFVTKQKTINAQINFSLKRKELKDQYQPHMHPSPPDQPTVATTTGGGHGGLTDNPIVTVFRIKMEEILANWAKKPETFDDTVKPKLPESGKRNILITSALPYVNNVPHLGNIIGCVLSGDVFSRFCRMNGYRSIHVCGTDEYGTATEMKALQEGTTPKEICDRYFKLHKQIYEWFNIDFDIFGRTSTDEQTEICQDIFLKLHEQGFTSISKLDQLHCSKCNKFLADRYVNGTCPLCGYDDARGDQCDKCAKLLDATNLVNPKCQICGTTPTVKTSEHIFIDLTKLSSETEKYLNSVINDPNSRWSPNAISIAQSWIKAGLEKRCITRDLVWGTKVPLKGFENKVFYVWFDAPIGYLSITKRLVGDDWVKWWKNKDIELFQFVGKDNVAFHSIVFPSTQLGTREPYTMVRHLCATEYLNYENQKFSKSRGVGVFGDAAALTGIPADIWRFYLLYMRPEAQDTTFSWDDFALKVNTELSANLGNFINRAMTFLFKTYKGSVPEMNIDQQKDQELFTEVNKSLADYIDSMEKVKMRNALQAILAASRQGNLYMQTNEPWKLMKSSNPEEKARAGTVIGVAANLGALLSVMLYPFMPKTSEEIRRQCGIDKPLTLPKHFIQFLPAGTKTAAPKILFELLKPERITEWKTKFGTSTSSSEQPPAQSMAETPADNKEMISRLLLQAESKFEVLRKIFVQNELTKLNATSQKLAKEVETLRVEMEKCEAAAGKTVYSAKVIDELKNRVITDVAPAASQETVQNTAEPKLETKADAPKQKAPKKAENKKDAPKKDGGAAKPEENDAVDVGRLDLRVGRIVHVEKHPDADALYVEKIDLGEGQPRTVISGLVKHVPLDKMQDRLVVCVCNLKPAKMRGIESQAMILCASTPEKVEIMEVPSDSKPGDRVYTTAFTSRPDAVLNPKKKVWETVAVDLKVSSDGKGAYKGEHFVGLMYRSLAHFRRLYGRLNIVRQVANFSIDVDDQKTQDEWVEPSAPMHYKAPFRFEFLINPSSAPLTNEEIKEILENVKLHHVRFIFNRILAQNCFDKLLILVPYFIQGQLVNNKTVLPIVQALSRAWIQKGPTEQITSVAEQLRPFLSTNNLGRDAKILLDICSGVWPISLENANDILLFKDDCFDALIVAALRNSDSRKLKEVIKLFPNRYMHSSPDVFEVFLKFTKSNKFLLGVYLNQLRGKVIDQQIFEHIKKVALLAKGGEYARSRVVDGKCVVCKETLTERTLTKNEFNKLTEGFTSYFHEQCKLNKVGTMAELRAIDNRISEIKERPNCKSIAVIDGLNINGGRMKELPGFMDKIRLVKNTYDAVFLIMRIQILSDRMKLLQQEGIDFFRLGKHSLDDLFAIYATLKLGQDANLVSNDRFADIVRELTVYPGLAELFTVWAKNQTIGHSFPARLCEASRYSNLLEYSPKDKIRSFHGILRRSYPAPPESELEPRAPVVTIMGHVDHGKTTLLDSLRNSRLVSQEFGGITQHIGAFSVKLPNSDARVTFLDTPGHAAFKEMRARGARSTDIVVLVVAADDGVKDQTVESIKYAIDAKVPMVIAINKCDKPSADAERAKRSLLEYGIVGEDLGGDTQIVEISALYGKNIDALQEALILQAELMELKSTSKGPVEGVVIESTTVQGLGKVCTLIVKRGTLKKGTVLVAGSSWGKVRSMVDEFGKPVTKAGPSTPVRISGWRNKLPHPGEISYEIVDGESKAQKIAGEMAEREMLRELDKTKDDIIAKREADRQIYLANREILHSRGIRFGSVNRNLVHKEHKFTKQSTEDEKPTVRLILRTDVDGTLEAIQNVLDTYDFDEVDLQIIDAAVGPPIEEIVEIAAEFKAYIVCFNTPVSFKVKELAAQKNVEIEQYNIIYKLVDALKLRLDRTYGPLTELELAGEGHVLKEFMIADRERKRLPIAGTLVDWGVFTKDATYRFSRNGETIYEGQIESLKRVEEFVSEANVNTEVGISVGDKKIRFKTDDTVEAFKEVTRDRQVIWSPPGF